MSNTLLGFTCYNHYPFTYLALKSIEKYTPELKDRSARLLVIDNNSTDETQSKIMQDFPWISEFIVEKRDCIPYQLNIFLNKLEKDEDFLMCPNDIVVGPNWLKLLIEDTYKYDEVTVGSPYLPVDLQYDEVVNQDWADRYNQVYTYIKRCTNSDELENWANKLYGGNFEQFCLDFQERNQDEPPIDCQVTHLMLFKSKLFEDGFRFNDIDYPNYYGSWEFDLRAELSNRGYFGIASSRSYVHHWISIANQDSNIALTEKQKEIRKNNIKLFQKWHPLPDSVFFLNKPMPSKIPNWRTAYFKYKLNNPELNQEEASKIPGIKFLTFQGITPGHDRYFNQIQTGSIIRKDGKSYLVNRKLGEDKLFLYVNNEDRVGFFDIERIITKEEFVAEKWGIDYYKRDEEESYFGNGHMNFLLEN